MLNKKTYEALDILKDNNPDIYSVIDTFLNDSLKELSYAAHEIKNQISFFCPFLCIISSHSFPVIFFFACLLTLKRSGFLLFFIVY